MAGKWLTVVNILAAVATVLIVALFWLYVPREQFLWGIYLIFLILMLVVYANVRRPLMNYIEARRKKKNLQPDPKSEQRLRIINYAGVIAVLAIAVFFWLFMREQFMWAVILMVLVLLLMGLINFGKIASDIG